MDWRGHNGSREANLMASAAILIRDGMAGQITVTEMGMWIDSKVARDIELSGPGDCLWRRKHDALTFRGCSNHSLT